MYNFCFNDCIPNDSNNGIFVSTLTNSLREYDAIKKAFPEIVTGIHSHKSIDKIILNNNNFSLENCISLMERSYRIIALRDFGKFPLEATMKTEDEDYLLNTSFFIKVGEESLNALNPKIASENNGLLFTLAIHSDLKQNILVINEDPGRKEVLINNLYGEKTNTDFVIDLIKEDEAIKAGNFEVFLHNLGDNIYSEKFKKQFDNSSLEIQLAVIELFKNAKKRDGVTSFFPDGSLIKDVTPDNEKEIKVYELRMFNPVAFRIYFFESETKIYLASMEKKPPKKVQNTHILNAKSTIKQLYLLDH